MAPSESAILSKFLLLPSDLPAILTPAAFAALFPRSLTQSSSSSSSAAAAAHIRALYHDLQAQRAATVDAVAANIDAHVAGPGRDLRRAVARQRRVLEVADGGDDEIAIEQALYTPAEATALPPRKPHSLPSIVAAMDAAVAGLEAQLAALRAEEAALLQSVRQTVGSLSDLRYGKPANEHLRDEVLDGLHAVESVCRSK
ncbi:hypothetical protein TD95_001933 [Thielaviopsis punctulata]|uniref:Cnl2/NKP2 family protein n=1 Tax=Thielaviopsis punctulata TaxID=72032 RepID=A0A0F4ZHJ4_9PEZI|nr:hypothetical protein TD95_001933 [Thielaviopsis punctulata]